MVNGIFTFTITLRANDCGNADLISVCAWETVIETQIESQLDNLANCQELSKYVSLLIFRIFLPGLKQRALNSKALAKVCKSEVFPWTDRQPPIV